MLAYIIRWVASHIRLSPLQVITIVLALSLCSCGSSKKVDYINKVYKATSTNVDTSYLVTHKSSLKKSARSLYEGLHVKHVVYDTSISDSLGRHPVLSETTITRNRESGKKGSEQSENKQVASQSVTTSEVNDSTSYFVSGREIAETQVPGQIGHVIKWVCIAIGLIIVWNIVRRYGRK